MGPLSRGVANVIGLGTEAYEHHKRSKSPSTQPGTQAGEANYQPGTAPEAASSTQLAPPPYPGRSRSNSLNSDSDGSYYEDDEDDWARDETQAQLETQQTREEAPAPESMDALVDNFLRKHPQQPPPYSQPAVKRLSCPVIIPQKRPESKSHGFIRAVSASSLFLFETCADLRISMHRS